jgi:hypothetical protein
LKINLRSGLLALAFALTFMAIGAGIAFASQPYMVNARNDLQAALTQLQSAQQDKGGHRSNAINLVQEAIRQVNLGIQYSASH